MIGYVHLTRSYHLPIVFRMNFKLCCRKNRGIPKARISSRHVEWRQDEKSLSLCQDIRTSDRYQTAFGRSRICYNLSNEDHNTPPPKKKVGKKNQRTTQNIFPNVKVKKRLDYTSLHANTCNCRCTLPGANKNNHSLHKPRTKIKTNTPKTLQ